MEKKEDKNLQHSIIEGTADSVKSSFGDSFLSAFAIALGATNMQIGFLASIPKLISSLSQLLSSTIVEFLGSRKKMISTGVLLQTIMWIPVFFVFLLIHKVWFLIFFWMIYSIAGSITSPAWRSLMGDIVPDSIKGRYFGKRNKIVGFSGFISMLIAGLLLQYFSSFSYLYGFGIIFAIALIARLVSWRYLEKMDEPKYVVPIESKFSFMAFVKRMKMTNYGIFVIYRSFLSFAVQVASPFFAVYMLRDLGFSYWTYTMVSVASTIPNFLSMTIWGKYGDRFGNKTILTLTGLMVPFIPLWWLFSKNVWYLIIAQMFAGFFWAGFNLSSFNFVYDTVSPPKRMRCVSYFNVLNGIGVFLGAIVGGFLIKFGTMFLYNAYLVFFVSGILRLLMSIVFLPKIREVKEVEKVSHRKLLWTIFSVDVIEGFTNHVAILRKRRLIAKRPFEKLIEGTRRFLEKTLKKK